MAMTLEELGAAVASGSVDTVLLAITDMQGRLQGKRCSARYFLEEVVPHHAEACNSRDRTTIPRSAVTIRLSAPLGHLT